LSSPLLCISWNNFDSSLFIARGFHLLNMAENVDDILDLHANESEEDSFEKYDIRK
jgi:hypothetical protein